MTLRPIGEITPDQGRAIALIATDMDGTLTIAEKFTPALLQALEAAQAAGLPVLIVTGRSAGWVSGLCHYLPIVGAIAENGGIFYDAAHPDGDVLSPIGDRTLHRQALAVQFTALQQQFPHLQASADNAFRITDWTFDVQGLSDAAIATLADHCTAHGWGFTYSTVQCHIKLPQQDKAQGLRTVLARHFPHIDPATLLTVGDSPNDAPLFNPAHFPQSVGVANVRHYCDRLPHPPAYLTIHPEGRGFCELLDHLLQVRRFTP
jgi:hydroxymethylpyrimidine pyrophosphatase-like HAD family hydrolase